MIINLFYTLGQFVGKGEYLNTTCICTKNEFNEIWLLRENNVFPDFQSASPIYAQHLQLFSMEMTRFFVKTHPLIHEIQFSDLSSAYSHVANTRLPPGLLMFGKFQPRTVFFPVH